MSDDPSFAFIHPRQTRLGASLSRQLYVGMATCPPIHRRVRPITGGGYPRGGGPEPGGVEGGAPTGGFGGMVSPNF